MASNYSIMTQREHVLKRPGMYIGSTDTETSPQFFYNDGKLVRGPVKFIPALHKLFDEVVSNASDNFARGGGTKLIKVKIGSTSVSVFNDGNSIPFDDLDGLPTPTVVFGKLLSGSSFNDDAARTTAGVNGLGVKLCNVWSTKFKISIIHKGQKFVQTWKNNMSKVSKPKITPCAAADSVSVEFTPDFARFGTVQFTEPDIALMSKRAADLTFCFGLDVRVNNRRLFKNRLSYLKALGDKPVIDDSKSWTVAVFPNRSEESDLIQLSFANGVCTTDGGTHVRHVVQKLSKILSAGLKKAKLSPSPKLIKDSLKVVVRLNIDKPSFNSQSKAVLVTKSAKFKAWEPSAKFCKALLKSEVFTHLVEVFTKKLDGKIAKQDGKKTARVSVPKLIDAKFAGTSKSKQTTLILAEGDSALAMLLKGVTANRLQKTVGLFPLKGKLLNVSDASKAKLMGNAEIQNLKKILGLTNGKLYTDTSSLRYGRVLVATDADDDGMHILGLVLTMFRVLYPNLVQIGYVQRFSTPLLIAKRGPRLKEFFSLEAFKEWQRTTANSSTYAVKFLKGLGSSSNADARRYFRDMQAYVQVLKNPQAGLASLDMAFSKSKIVERKEFVSKPRHSFEPGTLDGFIKSELHGYTRSSLLRAIPSIDGFKESTRKILWTMLSKSMYGEKKDVKVSELAGLVSKFAHYHHGQTSLEGAIVTLARRYTSVNNLPLLVDAGQFGSYTAGGGDAASSRYIYSRLEDVCKLMFNAADLDVLPRHRVDGELAEPKLLMPLLPMALVNGAAGIATGFSTNIWPHAPTDLIATTIAVLDGTTVPKLVPSFRDWHGDVSVLDGGFTSTGKHTVLSDVSIKVNSLAVGLFPNTFQAKLQKLKDKGVIKNFDISYLEPGPQFAVTFAKKTSGAAMCKTLGLVKTHSTNNMHLLDKHGVLKKYGGAQDILQEYVELKLQITSRRIKHQIRAVREELDQLDAVQRFIQLFLDGNIVFKAKSAAEIDEQLQRHALLPHKQKLLSLPIRRLAAAEIEKAAAKQHSLEQTLAALQATTPKKTYKHELKLLLDFIKPGKKRKGSDENKHAKKCKK